MEIKLARRITVIIFNIIVISFILFFFYLMATRSIWHVFWPLIPIIWLLVGSFFLSTSLGKIKVGLASKTWSVVKGSVLTSDVMRSTQNEGTSYSAMIKYRYEVNGTEYQSASLNAAPFWWIQGLQGSARKKVAQYTPNKIVDVYYNPQSPETAFLEPGVHLAATLLGVIVFIISLFLAFYLFLLFGN
jgi:spore germination protein GerM